MQKFLERVLEGLRKEIPDTEFMIKICEDHRGIEHIGIATKESFTAFMPMEESFASYQDGASYDEVFDDIRKSFVEALENKPQIDFSLLLDYEYAKKNIFLNLVKPNKNFMEKAPFTEFHGLVIAYRILIGDGSVLVDNTLLEHYGVSKEEFHSVALENSKNMLPMEIMEIGTFGKETENPVPLFIATNKDYDFGASVICYPNFYQEAYEKVKGDFKICPVSEHFCFLVPKSFEISVPELIALRNVINRTDFSEEECLSDSFITLT